MQHISLQVFKFLQKTFKKQPLVVQKLIGDASLRNYFRLSMKKQTYIVMVTDSFLSKKDLFLKVQDSYRRAFVQVPQIKTYSEKLGVIVLEDLGDKALEMFPLPQYTDLYKKAIDELMKIHFKVSSKSIGYKTSFDVKTFMWEIDHSLEYFVRKNMKINLEDSFKREIRREFLDICSKLSLMCHFLCHRDYHSRNIMVYNDKTFVIDFQHSRKGPLAYDIVSLLHDPYHEMNYYMRKKFYDYFLYRTQEFCNLSKENFKSQYHLQILQRCFKICGNYAAIFHLNHNNRYLKYIRPSVRSLCEGFYFHPYYKHIGMLLERIKGFL